MCLQDAIMNYRHIFHAGNFADVVKHIALVAVLLHLRRKEKPFCVIDTHAGSGLYAMQGSQAQRSRESAAGVARLADLSAQLHLPDALRTYLDCVNREHEGMYPGSPRLVARLLRAQDRLVAMEKHSEEAAALTKALSEFRHARAVEADSYLRLPALLPPRERRGLVLIDPPYEAEDESLRAINLLAQAHSRFANGIYLLWLPMKSRAEADAASGELRTLGIGPAVRLDIDVDPLGRDQSQRLSSARMIIVNPPYTFESEIRAAAPFVTARLGRAPNVPAEMLLDAI
jgi:23S rRNA (adenine2030-N6)-methyltransferase